VLAHLAGMPSPLINKENDMFKEKEPKKPNQPSKLSVKIKKIENSIDQIKEDLKIVKSRLGL